MDAVSEITLNDELIAYETTAAGNSFELPLTALKGIFTYQSLDNQQGYIFLDEKYSRKFVPTGTSGLETLFAQLSKTLSIPPTHFDIAPSGEVRSRIYFRPSLKNYQLLPNSYAGDLTEGFELIGAKSIFCKWDTTINDLEKLGVVESLPVGESGTKLVFSYPVRMGTILIDGLEIYGKNQRKDYPIESYYFKLTNAENTKDSFYDLCVSLQSGEDKMRSHSDYNYDSQLFKQLSLTNIEYKITYPLSASNSLELGYTSCFIQNGRVYYNLLKLFDQYSTINPTACIFFKEEVKIYKGLNKNHLIGITPKGLSLPQAARTTIWIDEELQIIGISQLEYSYVFELKQIDYFTITNVRPAKGRGGAGLGIAFLPGEVEVEKWLLLQGPYPVFDKSAAMLEAMSGKAVNFAQEREDV